MFFLALLRFETSKGKKSKRKEKWNAFLLNRARGFLSQIYRLLLEEEDERRKREKRDETRGPRRRRESARLRRRERERERESWLLFSRKNSILLPLSFSFSGQEWGDCIS